VLGTGECGHLTEAVLVTADRRIQLRTGRDLVVMVGDPVAALPLSSGKCGQPITAVLDHPAGPPGFVVPVPGLSQLLTPVGRLMLGQSPPEVGALSVDDVQFMGRYGGPTRKVVLGHDLLPERGQRLDQRVELVSLGGVL
jgi:hypothetical protein